MSRFGNYHGGAVRKLFLVGGVLMLVSLPLLQSFIPISTSISILAVLVLTLGAGLMAPDQKWFILLDMIVAGLAVIVFEYYAMDAYRNGNHFFFSVNQVLAIIFFIAFYYAVKTVRGVFMGRS